MEALRKLVERLRGDCVLRTNADIVREARRFGPIKVVRYDREQGKVVTDLITADMPSDEVVT
jgi:hypothetical protein